MCGIAIISNKLILIQDDTKITNIISHKMKKKIQKINVVGTFLKSDRKIIKRGKIDTPYTQKHDPSLS